MQIPDISPGVYQRRVVIQALSPLLWRRLLVRSGMSPAALHNTLQSVFAWSDVQMHCFRIHGKEYGSMQLGDSSYERDPRHVPLTALRWHHGERVTDVDNFIDHWVCALRLEAIGPRNPRRHSPCGLAGKRASPPEDCGGP